MKFGVREICDVVLRAKSAQKIGDKVFYKNEPVLYFDSLKTSSVEGQATTVYAQGGRGNARLIAWEGERTVTFTMEDALISPMGFSVLTGAGLIKAEEKPIIVHRTEITNKVTVNNNYVEIELKEIPYIKANNIGGYQKVTVSQKNISTYYKKENDEYIAITEEDMIKAILDNRHDLYLYQSSEHGDTQITSYEAYLALDEPRPTTLYANTGSTTRAPIVLNNISTAFNYLKLENDIYIYVEDAFHGANDSEDFIYVMILDENGEVNSEPFIAVETNPSSNIIQIFKQEIAEDGTGLGKASDINKNQTNDQSYTRKNDISNFTNGCTVLVDYYVKKDSGAYQIDITPNKFGGNFYLEASTLFRSTNGVDLPAEFVIPNCKIQSNFTFTMASSGDPSTFTFTMDAFPDYTRWNPTEKVFATIQVIEDSDTLADFERLGTGHDYGKDVADGDKPNSEPYASYLADQKPRIDPNGKE